MGLMRAQGGKVARWDQGDEAVVDFSYNTRH
jgi:hypothetical protein